MALSEKMIGYVEETEQEALDLLYDDVLFPAGITSPRRAGGKSSTINSFMTRQPPK